MLNENVTKKLSFFCWTRSCLYKCIKIESGGSWLTGPVFGPPCWIKFHIVQYWYTNTFPKYKFVTTVLFNVHLHICYRLQNGALVVKIRLFGMWVFLSFLLFFLSSFSFRREEGFTTRNSRSLMSLVGFVLRC